MDFPYSEYTLYCNSADHAYVDIRIIKRSYPDSNFKQLYYRDANGSILECPVEECFHTYFPLVNGWNDIIRNNIVNVIKLLPENPKVYWFSFTTLYDCIKFDLEQKGINFESLF